MNKNYYDTEAVSLIPPPPPWSCTKLRNDIFEFNKCLHYYNKSAELPAFLELGEPNMSIRYKTGIVKIVYFTTSR